MCQIGIQSPEHFDDTQRRLCDGLGNITAGRRNRSDHRQGTFSSLFSKGDHTTRSLIKLRQTGAKVGGIAFFTRHFFQTSRHFTKRLCPPGSGVCHQRHGITHITEEFRNRDPGIDTGFSCRHRHIRRIGNQHGSLHQRLAGLGILQLWKLVQYVRHLISALSAADVDDNIRFRPFCQLVLYHRFSGSERTGNRRYTSLCNREEGVNDSLSGNQGHVRRQLLFVGTLSSDRPSLHQTDLFHAVLRAKLRNVIRDLEVALRDGFNRSLHAIRHHDFLRNDSRLLDGSQNVARHHFVTDLRDRYKMPNLISL